MRAAEVNDGLRSFEIAQLRFTLGYCLGPTRSIGK
jgi:hypothetical protein